MITDGEFRRATWHLDFMWGFTGVGHEPTKTGLPFHGEAAMIDDTYLTGKISVDQHPFVEHFKFVKALEDENTVAKQTILHRRSSWNSLLCRWHFRIQINIIRM